MVRRDGVDFALASFRSKSTLDPTLQRVREPRLELVVVVDLRADVSNVARGQVVGDPTQPAAMGIELHDLVRDRFVRSLDEEAVELRCDPFGEAPDLGRHHGDVVGPEFR